MKLAGKVALVTGAGQGIGRGIAVRLAEDGADVALADINEATLEEARREIEALGRRAIGLVADLSDPVAAEALPDRVVEQLGRIDILVNNAGIADGRSMWDLTEQHWDRMLDLNVKGVFFCLRGAARHMREQKSGKIINLASAAGKGAGPNHLHYSASKAAVISITRSAAAELAPHGVNVNCLCPGIVDTPLWVELDEAYAEIAGQPVGSIFKDRVSRIPLGRAAQPLDIARVAAFLASEDSDYMTGQAINVTGGVIMH